jgi:hypothetical protein
MAYGTINADLMTTSDGVSSSGLYGFKNRLINSAMVIDQRNAGASVTPTAEGYTLDRWKARLSQSSKYSVQQVTTAPAGFNNSIKVTSLSAYTVGSGELFCLQQPIEGYNIADLGFGSANAKTITVSFWVQSSLTGTFGGALNNSGGSRSYPFSYTISSANTWEQKTVTIVGDTSGTWLTTNGEGLSIFFSLGTGSTLSGTAGSWSGSTYVSVTGATSVVGTNGATFYITGVQLEKGSTATSFDYRPYGTELALCQRYFERSYNIGNATGSFTNGFSGFVTSTTSATDITPNLRYEVIKRDTPTVVVYNAVSGASGAAYRTSDAASISVSGINYSGTTGVGTFTLASGSIGNYLIHWTASSEL